MKGLGKYRIIPRVSYNSRAEHDHETWIVEEWSKNLIFGLEWHEHKEWVSGSNEAIKFTDLDLANEYVGRLLDGTPRDTVVKTVVGERE